MPRLRLLGFTALIPLALSAADIAAVKESGVGTNGFRPLVPADRVTAPLLASASGEGEARIKQFKLLPGMKVELWAAEPMLANPVAFSVDELGRVWTSETYRYRSSVLDIRHYMFMLEDDLASRSIEDRLKQIRKWFGPEGEQEMSKETEVIRLLEDTDHDGKADKSTVVVDGLNSPLDGIASGILARHGQIWFTDIPSVWKFSPGAAGKDAKAQPLTPLSPLASQPKVHLDGYQAEELLRGWGIRFSFTGHDLHGLKFGPDGRLYFSCGDRGTHVVTKEGNVIDLPDEGAVFRCEPDGTKLEVFAHGLRNPQELAFDEYGNLFTGDNDSDQGDRERWEYVVEGGDYGWRVGYQHSPLGNAGPWNSERLWVPHFEGQAAYIIPPIANIGDGPSGLVYNYGTGLPAWLDHRFFLADFKGTSAKSGIYSLLNRPSGAGFELVAHDQFVWNTLVPDVDIGPDGAVWFADWHEGWPKSNKGRIYRAYFPEAQADPVVKETAKLLAEGMEKRPEKELLTLLAHRDMRVRQEAQFELAARVVGDMAQSAQFASKLERLGEVARTDTHQFARIHAMWAIGQVARLGLSSSTHDSLAKCLNECLPLLHDTDAEIRTQCIRVLGEAGFANARLSVAALLADPSWRVRYFATLAYAKGLAPLTPFRIVMRRPEIRAALALGDGKTGSEKRDRAIGELKKSLGEEVVADELNGFTAKTTGPIADAMAKEIWGHTEADILLRHAASLSMANWPAVVVSSIAEKPRSLRLLSILASRHRKQSRHELGITNALYDPDPLLILEAARAINDVPITNALPALAALAEPAKLDSLLKQFALLKSPAPSSQLPSATGAIRDVRADQPLPWGDEPIDQLTPMLLRVVNANFRVGTPETAQRLAALAGRADLSDLIRSESLHALATWAKPHPRDRIVGIFRPLPERDAAPAIAALQAQLADLLAKSSEALRIAAAEAVAELKLVSASKALFELVEDTHAPANARATALRSLATVANDDASTALRDQALTVATTDVAEPLRLAASKLNAELHPDSAAGQLAGKLASGSLAEQQSAYASLGDLKSNVADAILAEQLDKLMKREIPNEVMLDLVEAASKRTAAPVQSRLAAYNKWKLPQDHLTPYRETLAGGNAARGRKIFYENAAVACTRCHQIGSDGGGNAGPSLVGVASRQPREYLLESIVFPNQ
ncbi:MAG TPA: PQQ-dependent sugar dehydrogenase, partial [Candidatus Limnocylindria bacterium]|nr:PQQ-dependent sugar dehydrogenase [Candidatus Limnocylindria bacterium]